MCKKHISRKNQFFYYFSQNRIYLMFYSYKMMDEFMASEPSAGVRDCNRRCNGGSKPLRVCRFGVLGQRRNGVTTAGWPAQIPVVHRQSCVVGLPRISAIWLEGVAAAGGRFSLEALGCRAL